MREHSPPIPQKRKSKKLPFPRKRESLPASAGNSAKRNSRLSANAAIAAEIPAFAGMECFFCLRQKKHSHPPPLAGGGKNSRQRIFGGWRSISHQRSFKHHRRLSTPRDRFRARTPPRKRRRVKTVAYFLADPMQHQTRAAEPKPPITNISTLTEG